MKRSKESSYIIELPLVTEKFQADEIDTRLECGRKIYNALVTVTMKRYREMAKTKVYRSLTAEMLAVNARIKNNKEKVLGANKKEISEKLTKLRNDYKLSEYAFYADVKEMQWHYKSKIHSQIAQDIATNVWKAYEKVLFGDGKEVHYKKYGEMNSLPDKSPRDRAAFPSVRFGLRVSRLAYRRVASLLPVKIVPSA